MLPLAAYPLAIITLAFGLASRMALTALATPKNGLGHFALS